MAVRASLQWYKASEQPSNDDLPQGAQARRWRNRWNAANLFGPRGLVGLREAQVLKIGVGDVRHQRSSVQAGPRSSHEVIEVKFVLELLAGLLTDPARLDHAGQGARCWA